MRLPPTLADVIGPMLGADFLYASGEVVETTPDHPDGLRHRFWAYRALWRIERSDGVTFVDGENGSVTLVHGRTAERGPRHVAGLHLPERMLRPRYADIWGRPSDDWQLTGDVDEGTNLPGTVAVGIARHDAKDVRGTLLVDAASGRLVRRETPTSTWELRDLDEESDGDPRSLFAV